MGIFGKLIQGTIDTVTLPVDVVKDVFTLGGASVGEDEPYTVQKLKKIKEKAEDIYDALDED